MEVYEFQHGEKVVRQGDTDGAPPLKGTMWCEGESSRAFAPSSFLLLVVRPGAPSSFLFLVAMLGAPSSVLAPSSLQVPTSLWLRRVSFAS